ncbi:ERM domain-containing protein [Rhizoctonia solani]|uniref:ERM domain-containing protein n=1 Tax=Rhizoctonia solani TaxID=456999 RepID=A0A8H8P827_9AGAM|nr:ERM domain-containing protein [Rhizoctonia solani]QRW26915.1 ERM domain-containing protein [Rhizoctonia solani]
MSLRLTSTPIVLNYYTHGATLRRSRRTSSRGRIVPSAIDACEDPSVKHSLRLMHEDHLKLSRDAQRAKQERTRQQQQQQAHQHQTSNRSSELEATITIDQAPRRMGDSTSSVEHTIEDSYMMLGGRPGEHNEAFDQFWKNLEGMLENLSQPAAFATAPLAGTSPVSRDKDAVGDDDDEGTKATHRPTIRSALSMEDDPFAPQTPKSASFGSSANSSPSASKRYKKTSVPDPSKARSAYPPPPRIQQLETENAALKSELERAVMRANTAERTLRQRAGQELALRESILSVRREAQRAMSATTAALRTPSFAGPPPSRAQTFIASQNLTAPVSPAVPAPAVVPAPVPPVPVPAVKLPDVSSPRIAELEEEVRQLKVENEKLKAQTTKYRERWEKIKESAKRKRAAKGQLETSSTANVTIPEEQEPEGEQPDGGQETPATPVAAGSGLNSHSILRSPESIVASH